MAWFPDSFICEACGERVDAGDCPNCAARAEWTTPTITEQPFYVSGRGLNWWAQKQGIDYRDSYCAVGPTPEQAIDRLLAWKRVRWKGPLPDRNDFTIINFPLYELSEPVVGYSNR